MSQIDRINGLIGSIAVKAPCRVATTANITLSGEQAIDGVSVVADDRVLVKNQTITSENGIYDVSATAWVRSPDFNGARDVVKGTIVRITEGTANQDLAYEVTSSGINIGTSALVFGAVNFPFSSDVVQSYANIAALRVITTAPAITLAKAKGYYTDGDGGGGDFYWDASSTETDNGGTIIKATAIAVGRWKRPETTKITARKFGSKGDGSTNDDTTMQAFLDYGKDTGATLYIENGEYILTALSYTPSSSQRPLNLIGEGALRAGEPEQDLAESRKRGVIFHFSTISGSSVGFDIGNGAANFQGLYMENIYILGQTQQNVASPTDNTIGLKVDNAPESIFRNVHCSRFNEAWFLEDMWASTLYNCSGVRSYMPIKFGTGANAIRFYAWKSHTCYWAGEITDSSAGITFSEPWFEILTNGFLINNGTNAVNGITFIQPHCENITNECFLLGYGRDRTTEATGDIASVHIIGGYYNSVGNTKLKVSASASRDIIIYGEMGNFDESSIGGTFEHVKLVRSERSDQNHSGGPYLQDFYGFSTGVADNTLTDLLTIELPDGDCSFQIDVSSSGITSLGSFTATTQGVIACGRKSASSNAYATYTETVAAVKADSGVGQSYAGVFVLSISLSTKFITLKITADNNQSQSSEIVTRLKSFGSARGRGSVRKLVFADA